MKVAIIGAGGRVGSNTAFALQLGGLVTEMAIIDANAEMAKGEALDLRHGSSMTSSQRIYAAGYEGCEGADIVIITAGLRRKPDESRLQLINRNVELFRTIMEELKKARPSPRAIILVVANPVDILTYIAVKSGILPASQVIGLGTVLDTCRFRSFLGEHFKVDPTQLSALILGEHGDSMVPIWSTAAVNGTPLWSLPGYREDEVMRIFENTKKSGAEVIKLKGGAGWAVAVAIKQVVDAILLDKRALLPVSSLQSGLFGIDDVCLSLPTLIGSKGVQELVEIKLWEKEKLLLQQSGRVLKETLAQVMQGAAK
ncbi:MAG: L-lactate dehydrogenase [Candidatus Xenobia bacterium]